jgi:hypothetical protein
MKTMALIRWGVLLVFLVVIANCTGVPVNFIAMPEQPHDVTRGRTIEARACGFQLLLVIPISINDRAARAYTELLEAAGGDYVTDIKVNEEWTYAFVGTSYCTEMRATAYPKLAAAVGGPKQEINSAPTSTGGQTQEIKKPAAIEECIAACRKNTKRTSEQCFDSCNH